MFYVVRKKSSFLKTCIERLQTYVFIPLAGICERDIWKTAERDIWKIANLYEFFMMMYLL